MRSLTLDLGLGVGRLRCVGEMLLLYRIRFQTVERKLSRRAISFTRLFLFKMERDENVIVAVKRLVAHVDPGFLLFVLVAVVLDLFDWWNERDGDGDGDNAVVAKIGTDTLDDDDAKLSSPS